RGPEMGAREAESPTPRRSARGRQKRTEGGATARANDPGADERAAHTTMINAVGGSVPVTEWDRLSAEGRAGELLNDIIGLNEHMAGELTRVGKVVGQEGRMHERASVGPVKGAWAVG